MLTVLVVSIFAVSCNSKETAAVELSKDRDFILAAQSKADAITYFAGVIKRNNLDPEQVNSELQGLSSSRLSDDEQLQRINTIFREDVSGKLTEHMKTFSTHWKRVQEKYPGITQEQINSSTADLEFVEETTVCGWRYNVCIAGTVAVGIGCHSACIGGTLGLGTPVCVVICVSAQAAAAVVCYDTYCKP